MLGATPNLSTHGGLKRILQTKKSARLKDADKSGQQTKVANAKSGALPDQPQDIFLYIFFSFVIHGRNPPFSKFKQQTDKKIYVYTKNKRKFKIPQI